MTIAIEARGVSYSVGEAQLLREVTLAAAPGELLAIIGPNGAGKSTLISVLAGDLAPSSGSVEIGGMAVDELSYGDLALMRSVLGQARTANVPFTVEEVVAMGRRLAADRDVEPFLTSMDLVELRHRIVGSLSGGEHTRVELARVLAQEAPVVLLDEPLAALDVAHQETVMRMLRSIARDGLAVVTVLHDLNAAAAHADRIALMAGGSIVAEGAPEGVLDAVRLAEVYRHPMIVTRVGTRLVVLPDDAAP